MFRIRFQQTVWSSLAALAFCALALLAPDRAAAVRLDDDNKVDVVLKDGLTVILYGEATDSGAKSNKYYYLPANLHLSQRPDGTPEFLFLKFTTEATGGVSGALMHFLMLWDLSPAQMQELKGKLTAQVRNAEVMGAVPLTQDSANGGSFQIVSATLSDKGLAQAVVTSGKAPLVPGGKAAAASRLSADGAQLLAATFEKARSITDLSIALNYAYETIAPAAKGTITFDWTRLEKESESLRADYARKQTGTRKTSDCFMIFCASSSRPTYTYSYDEVRDQYKFLEEKQIVKLDWMESRNDERLAKVREAFFQYFLTSMTEKTQQPAEAPPPAADKKDDKTPDIRQGNGYHFSQTSVKKNFQRKTQVMSLSARMAYKSEFQIVGNLASWYNGVRDNPKCVAAVNLNDRFFQHRDIHFILDLDGKEMFDEAVNYVTVNVRKLRDKGTPFEDRVTIDAKYMKEKGINATVTYARGEDKNPDTYEWMAQWSLKGGKVYPEKPEWMKGTFDGVTLKPPVIPRLIEVEADLKQMDASDVSRVTVQIHYPQFGQETEENIAISPAQNQPLVSKKIFTDRDAKGYVYRLVVNHKTEGKLALKWSDPMSDNYIYAKIPDDLLKDATAKHDAKEAGKAISTSPTEKVLDDLLPGSTGAPKQPGAAAEQPASPSGQAGVSAGQSPGAAAQPGVTAGQPAASALSGQPGAPTEQPGPK
jgi:hypothetical protein